jgi:hypothetical protein
VRRPGGARATSFDDLHAEDYLEYAYLQMGRDAEARGVVERVARVERLDVPNFAAAYALAAVPTRYAVERGKWSEAAKLEARPSSFPWEKFRNAEAILCFGRALGAARSGDLAGAREAAGRLETIKNDLDKKGDKYWSGQVEIQRLEAASWIARAERKDEEAIRLARSAADLEGSTDKHAVTPGSIVPARDLLGDLLLDLQQPGPALVEYEASLARLPTVSMARGCPAPRGPPGIGTRRKSIPRSSSPSPAAPMPTAPTSLSSGSPPRPKGRSYGSFTLARAKGTSPKDFGVLSRTCSDAF